jgi:hypothetical protein
MKSKSAPELEAQGSAAGRQVFASPVDVKLSIERANR